MSFVREISEGWHQEVPGSRWFKADLHVHTLDDRPGGQMKVPPGVDLQAPSALRDYAHALLREAIRTGVQVLGLTPHAVKLGSGAETSAVWQIVETWNAESDADGVPYRDRIYAVFPGFEISFKDGRSGLHLLFMFDPEIGRETHQRVFDLMMGGVTPWRDRALEISNRTAEEAFDELRAFMDREVPPNEHGRRGWDVLVLAPHVDGDKGIFSAKKAQVLQHFEHARLAGLELPDGKLPEDLNREKPRLAAGMAKYRHAFYHASDAYGLAFTGPPGPGQLGHRVTWFKLAAPRIEALRQAFIASDSRLRIAYERAEDGSLRPLPDPPDPLGGSRCWLRGVSIQGDAAFFGASGGQRIPFSPDLTCIIGGSMTGKSTLLDGLRVHLAADLPREPRLREDVQERGRNHFLAGRPTVHLDVPGCGTEPTWEDWPAVFFTQNELRHLADEHGAVEEIIASLAPANQASLRERRSRIEDLDRLLFSQARALAELLDERAEAEQQHLAAREAKDALARFEQAGLAKMQATEVLEAHVRRASSRADEVVSQIEPLVGAIDDTALGPESTSEMEAERERLGIPSVAVLSELHATAARSMRQARQDLASWADALTNAREALGRAAGEDRAQVERRLAEMGLGAEKLAEFQNLSRRAGLEPSYAAACAEIDAKMGQVRKTFNDADTEREGLVSEQRRALDEIAERIVSDFEERIRVRRIEDGVCKPLEEYLAAFKRPGISGWWNRLGPSQKPSPKRLYDALEADALDELGVSPVVADRFREVFDKARRYELRALRCPDEYILESQVAPGEYRPANQLSGGKRVSLLLSLLLESHDPSPLVIDQPEDELDNRFLWKTVLPALRRLKGRRQIIVATHDANIVVNGDADLVVQLEADSRHGRVGVAGAIEETPVRTAIVETVDGGADAFALRQAKYGF